MEGQFIGRAWEGRLVPTQVCPRSPPLANILILEMFPKATLSPFIHTIDFVYQVYIAVAHWPLTIQHAHPTHG